MQSNPAEHYSIDASPILEASAHRTEGHSLNAEQLSRRGRPTEDCLSSEPTRFHGTFASSMEMYAEARMVAQYLDEHREWFPRCAHPMQSESIGETGYALTVGRFGAFGYDVEPKVGLDLLPQQAGIYRIATVSVPGYEPPGYDVDFQAALQLVEIEPDRSLFAAKERAQLPDKITHVEWELDLQVFLHFPRFIQALPKSLVQSTGDRLLNQIVRQVSRRLTQKVQEDFHTTAGVPFYKKKKGL
ncbi:DUF1997 domain-containing protein [Leptolyngbya sp. FACHB-711]|uniref:DUF1997 domain-containing protein n=1 Tax=unclassified Leptolyngbya TaxID=2650499 RepID=UPI00168701C9|nr:DUF1997 domain-containing protein [Leptolyngbya sp. FACHB-711]MBD1850718.1 DUF1997 domain-containing protein [Cyanobacteria bacterium FACHB-502]MBD2026801.1 DUF1997 domain-containing protein [Leptolyngbya sp. FACHB-711]